MLFFVEVLGMLQLSSFIVQRVLFLPFCGVVREKDTFWGSESSGLAASYTPIAKQS